MEQGFIWILFTTMYVFTSLLSHSIRMLSLRHNYFSNFISNSLIAK